MHVAAAQAGLREGGGAAGSERVHGPRFLRWKRPRSSPARRAARACDAARLAERERPRGWRRVAGEPRATFKEHVGDGHPCVVADLSQVADVRRAAAEAGDVDALVNAAGVGAMASFLDVETDAFDQCVAVNCRAPLVLSQCVARNMIARGVPGAVRGANQPSERLTTAGFPHRSYTCRRSPRPRPSATGARTVSRRRAWTTHQVHGARAGAPRHRTNCVNPTVVLTPLGRAAWAGGRSATPCWRASRWGAAEVDDVADCVLPPLGRGRDGQRRACRWTAASSRRARTSLTRPSVARLNKIKRDTRTRNLVRLRNTKKENDIHQATRGPSPAGLS